MSPWRLIPEGALRRILGGWPGARRDGAATGADRGAALLDLSRALAAAADEEALAAAVARGMEGLFPGLACGVRLVDPRTLALGAAQATRPWRPVARGRIALRRAAAVRAGLPTEALEAAGIDLVEQDQPALDGADGAVAVPMAVAGQLHGVLHLEGAGAAPPAEAEALLLLVAGQAALAARSLRALEEATYLKAFLEKLIENANALIAVVNAEREVIVFNRAFAHLVGRARDEVLGEELDSIVPESGQAALQAILGRTFAGEAVTGAELRFAPRGGGEARVIASSSAIYGSSGAVEGVMLIGQDQTLLRALQERAEHAQKLAETGRLAAGIVHELNNPLTAVSTYAEALLSKLSLSGQDPADLEKLRRIRDAAHRIQRFGRDLIAYARPPQDQPEPVALEEVLRHAAHVCEPTLKAAGAHVELRFDEVPPVWGVRGSLLQVFVNLIVNAAHALEPEGGAVTLELAAAGDHVAARVRDDGPGMTPEVRRRALEPFFTTKTDGKGSGLGLSIVQGIVSRHGGAISIESAPGQGTTVTIMVPVKAAG